MKKSVKFYRYLLYILPLVLCFSYFPLIKLGENETMYFELSLPLIWLVVFDIFSLALVVKKYRGRLFTKVFGSALWWLFPFFVTFSVIWSLNHLRGFLTVGVMWTLFLAVLCFWELSENLDAKFWKVFWRWFFGSAIFVCAWCVVQCFLDIFGVSQGNSLLCDGCVYQMFGFPHPNGFAIEPQFMGNLLLAPIIVTMWRILRDKDNSTSRTRVARARRYGARALVPGRNLRMVLEALLLFVLCFTLFLTFSRGAIYACTVGMVFLFGFTIFRAKKSERKKVGFSILKTFGVFVVAFLFTLNLQGILAASSPTSDTYADGVAKVINQLSLGIIDVRNSGENAENSANFAENQQALQSADQPVENSEITEGNGKNGVVENFEVAEKTEAAFDGYVAESTDTRLRLASAALTIWRQDFKTAMFGVGIGGAGQALYDHGLSPAPREIVQNEYASLLLETGAVGVSLFGVMIVMAVRVFAKNKNAGLLLALMVAYGVTLLFFSGITNALQIVLLPGLLVLMI